MVLEDKLNRTKRDAGYEFIKTYKAGAGEYAYLKFAERIDRLIENPEDVVQSSHERDKGQDSSYLSL